MIALEQAGDDDVAALDQPDLRTSLDGKAIEERSHPWAGGVDEGARFDGAVIGEPGLPNASVAACRDQFGPGGDLGAVRGGVAGIGEGEAGIVDPGVRIDEAAMIAGERIGEGSVGPVKAPGTGQGGLAGQ